MIGNNEEIIPDQKFEVEIKMGDLFINGRFVSQLNWNADSVGMSITRWLENGYEEE